MSEKREHISGPDKDLNILLKMCLKFDGDEIVNEVEVNTLFMSHLKRNPEDAEHFFFKFC